MDLVKMRREPDGKAADVHPDEVANYQLAGYMVVESKPAPKPAAKRGRPRKSV